MAAKPRFRIRSSALAAIATAIGFLAFASASLADTGGVYFDSAGNAAAGDPAQLFNGSFTGGSNVGLGPSVMPNLTSGFDNVAVGHAALDAVTGGFDNVAVGSSALLQSTDATQNIAIGMSAGFHLETGSRDIYIGNDGGSNAGESGVIRIGEKVLQKKAFLAGVWNKTISGPVAPQAVLINSNGQLGTQTLASARRARRGRPAPPTSDWWRR